ncbi:topology modulation protein [Paenisporosarcina sp. FSL H8-0542]|uniref:topology modulation protein n=1 Tax=Paenisporosarcina sp. FSL H8-0542 TaxID=2921401 RepID=UPI00315A0AD8
MKKIMVIGISAGAGKSTFARRLGEAWNLPVFHLDTLFWKPNWVEASLEEFSKAQQEIVTQDQWIVEGNYSNTFDIRAAHADTIIYLELPLHVCLYRVVKRSLMNLGKTRQDLGEGCKDKLEWAFIKFILTTYYPRKRNMDERLQSFQAIGPTKKVITLKSKKEIQSYLDNVCSYVHP